MTELDFKPSLRVALTGATGFVGAETLQALLENGHSVRALVRNAARVAHIQHTNLEWIEGGLGDCDEALVKDADVVVHIAGLIKAQTRSDFYAVNADAAGKLAQTAELAGAARFVLMSSLVARQPELSDYAGSKAAGEAAVKANFTSAIATLRAPAVFGARDLATRPFYQLIEKGVLPIPGGAKWQDRRLAMVYIHDLIGAIIQAVEGEYDNQTRSPATIDHMRWLDFAKYSSQAVGRPVRPLRLPLFCLYPVAAVTTVTSRLFNKGHLTLGKLNEFLYEDWSGADVLPDATPFVIALQQTLRDYKV